jgi:hypothetical protein
MAGSKMGIEMIPREVKHYEMKKEGGNQWAGKMVSFSILVPDLHKIYFRFIKNFSEEFSFL